MSGNKTEQLKKEILKAQEQGDIAKLYTLEQEVQDNFNEDLIVGYYKNILDLALERLTDILESKSKLSFESVSDVATVRALYEYAIEHYHAGKIYDAAALFEVLSGITDSKDFSDALKIHTKAANKNISLDQFLEDYVMQDEIDTFYINKFTKEAQNLLLD